MGRGGTFGNVLRINPPICVTDSDIDFIADVLAEALNRL